MNLSSTLYLILFILILIILILLNSVVSFISFLLFGVIYYYLLKILVLNSNYITKRKLTKYYLLIYLLNSIVGLSICTVSYYTYSSYFYIFGDDLYYFNNIKNFSVNELFSEFNSHTSTDFINYLLYKTVNLYKSVTVLDLLFSHWALASIILILIFLFTSEVIKESTNWKIIFIGFIVHYVYSFALLSFYRDTYVILFYTLSFYYTIKRLKLNALSTTILAGIFRGINGIYSLLFFFIHSVITQSRNFKYNFKFKILLIISGLVFVLNLSFVQEIIINRSKNIFVESITTGETNSFTSFIKERQRGLIEDENIYDSNTFDEGPSFFAKALLIPLFSPANFVLKPYENIRVFVPNSGFISTKYFNINKILMFIYMLFMPIVVSKLIQSIYINIFHSKNRVAFLLTLFFIFSYITCSVVSLVSRHYLMFLILMPSIINLGLKNKKYNFRIEKTISYVIYIYMLVNTIKFYLK